MTSSEAKPSSVTSRSPNVLWSPADPAARQEQPGRTVTWTFASPSWIRNGGLRWNHRYGFTQR